MNRLVVIGYNGSPAGRAALRWAAAEAERRHCTLRIVHVTPPAHSCDTEGSKWAGTGQAQEARHFLDEARELSRREHGHLRIDIVSSVGDRAPLLLREALDASILVVGAQRASGDLAAGSVMAHVATYAGCPVVVVPDAWTPRGVPQVVVGVDGSAGSAAAVAFALQHAEMTGGGVTAVLAWSDAEASGLTLLKESLADQLASHPRIVVRERLASGPAANVLLDAAESAHLLVVGASGLQSFPSLLLGSVGQAVLRHAVCPVAVVR